MNFILCDGMWTMEDIISNHSRRTEEFGTPRSIANKQRLAPQDAHYFCYRQIHVHGMRAGTNNLYIGFISNSISKVFK